MPVEHFFHFLAEDQKENAVGVILSKTGLDGPLGLRAIKAVTQRLVGIPYFKYMTASMGRFIGWFFAQNSLYPSSELNGP
jgi:hypothetical protein